jgi:hypothetical protein
MTRRAMWRLVSTTTGLIAALLVKNLLRRAYRVVRGDDPKTAFDSTSDRFSWPNTLAWAVAGGIGLVTAKIVGDRRAAAVWKAATGSAPPGTERKQ